MLDMSFPDPRVKCNVESHQMSESSCDSGCRFIFAAEEAAPRTSGKELPAALRMIAGSDRMGLNPGR